MNSIFNLNYQAKALIVMVLLSLATVSVAFAKSEEFSAQKTPQWQPISSDKLIRLPANIIEKRIQQDFQASPMAMRIAELEDQMQQHVSNIKTLQQSISASDSEDNVAEQFQILQDKSRYLDLLQQSHALRQTAMAKKQKLYQRVLNKLQHKNNKIVGSDTYRIQQAQSKSRQRMEKVMAQVDSTLSHSAVDNPTPYAAEYATNIAKISKLKKSIARHQGNASPSINGVAVSSQEYFRQLLMEISTEQSLLDQEKLMLSYMARLVALDAQSLEYQVVDSNVERGLAANKTSKAANVTDLFYQE